MDYIFTLLILAQEVAENTPAGDDTGSGGFFGSMMIPMAAIMLLFYFMIIAPQKREQQERANKLGKLKEKAHVLTTGGIYGVVTNIQVDQQRVTLRIDESTGTKMKVNLSAIAQVLDDENGDAKTNKSK